MLTISQELADELAIRILRTTVIDKNGCWVRTAYVHPKTGYSSISKGVAGKKTYYLAHRVMWVRDNGPIPEGLTVDHLCENRTCCNPAHLRAVTQAENVLRSRTNPTAIKARRTECSKGHPLPARTLDRAAKRKCSTCAAEASKRRNIARRKGNR